MIRQLLRVPNLLELLQRLESYSLIEGAALA